MTLTIQVTRMWPSLLLFCILLVPGSTHDRNKILEPEFDVKLPNLTVKQGSDASFTCVVKHLGEYKYGTLDVVVPADIIDTETSNDVVVSEGQSAILKCVASGFPAPKVKWKRQDGQPLPVSRELLSNPSEKIEVWDGERLPLRALQRVDTGAFYCLANNSVPPLVSKRVMVYVHFQPSIKVLNQLVAAPLGVNITLECLVEAVPRPQLSWFDAKSGQLILNSAGKTWQETEYLKDYLLRMRLSISYLQKEDFTEYNCTAGNALGADYAIIKLQLLPTPITQRPTTTTTTHVDVWRPNKHSNQNGRYNADGSVITGQGNIKHRIHKKKSQRGKGHRSEGGEFSEGYGEDSSADVEMLPTVPSSGTGIWGDRGNSRNSQRSGEDGSNSINSYNNNNRNSKHRYGGGAMDQPNLDAPASSSRSSKLIFTRFISTAPRSSLLQMIMNMFHSQLYFPFVALITMLIPIFTCTVMF